MAESLILSKIPAKGASEQGGASFAKHIVLLDDAGKLDSSLFYGAGSDVDAFYVHNQGTPSATWVINHALNKYPSVTIVDSAKTHVEGDVTYDNVNQLTVTFVSAFSGQAFIN